MNTKQIPTAAEAEKEAATAALPYTKEQTRVHNKSAAPAGTIYLVVKYKFKPSPRHKGAVLACSRLVLLGLLDSEREKIYLELWAKLKKHYGL